MSGSMKKSGGVVTGKGEASASTRRPDDMDLLGTRFDQLEMGSPLEENVGEKTVCQIGSKRLSLNEIFRSSVEAEQSPVSPSSPKDAFRSVPLITNNFFKINEDELQLLFNSRLYLASLDTDEILKTRPKDLLFSWPVFHAYLGTLYCRNQLSDVVKELNELLWTTDIEDVKFIQSLIRFGASISTQKKTENGNTWIHEAVLKIQNSEHLRNIISICRNEQPSQLRLALEMRNGSGKLPADLVHPSLVSTVSILFST